MTTWVLLAGLPGSGKSTLARALVKRLNAVIFDKDRIREAIFPGALTDYTQEQDGICMRAILDAAGYLTAQNRFDFVLLDGRTFSQRRQIDEVIQAAERVGADWRILHVSCSDAVVEERLRHPDAENPARNRNLTLYRRIQKQFEPIPYPKLEVDTSQGVDSQLELVEDFLITQSLRNP